MKIQVRILILLTTITIAFVVGLWLFRVAEIERGRLLTQERGNQQADLIVRILRLRSEGLRYLGATLTTTGDPLALEALDSEGVDLVMRNHGADAVSVFSSDGKRISRQTRSNTKNISEIPLSASTLTQVMMTDKPIQHFYIASPTGLLEVVSARVEDAEELLEDNTLPPSHVFVMRTWSPAFVEELKSLTGSHIEIIDSKTLEGEESQPLELGIARFSIPLFFWDGSVVAKISVSSTFTDSSVFYAFTEKTFFYMVIFAATFLLVVAVFLSIWVKKPLVTLEKSLNDENPALIEPIKARKGEFGHLATVIQRHFDQRKELLKEVDERRTVAKELRKSRDELRHAQKMEAVGRLAGGIAHDFNNLLTAIVGYSEMIISDDSSCPNTKSSADEIRKAADRGANLTRKLLIMSRRSVVKPKVLSVNRLISEMDQLLRRMIGEHIVLETSLDEHTGNIKADAGQMEQILMNLSINARDAMPKGGRLLIASDLIDSEAPIEVNNGNIPPGKYVRISVSDEGCGMTQEVLQNLFEPFFTTKDPSKGTGLGLATVYGIIEQSNSGIRVSSTEGVGSSFELFFASVDEVEEGAKVKAPVGVIPSDATVMVVEDEAPVRMIICNALTKAGFRVLVAENGDTAMKLSKQEPNHIDLLITDVLMPGVSGVELAVSLTKERPHTRVLFISGYSDAALTADGYLDQKIDLLEKPFTSDTLLRSVMKVLQQDDKGPQIIVNDAINGQTTMISLPDSVPTKPMAIKCTDVPMPHSPASRGNSPAAPVKIGEDLQARNPSIQRPKNEGPAPAAITPPAAPADKLPTFAELIAGSQPAPAKPTPPPAKKSAAVSPAPDTQQYTILFADDEAPLRTLVRAALTRMNFNLLEAENGERALELSRQYEGKIHLLLSDIMMPGMRGDEMARLLHQTRPETPVLFVSGYSDQVLSETNFPPTMVHHILEKPFGLDALSSQVKEIIQRHETSGLAAPSSFSS